MADVVIVDLLMPKLDGLSVIRAISAQVAVILVSSLKRDSAAIREAVAQGASEAFSKRDLADGLVRERLRAAVRNARRPCGAMGGRLVVVAGSTGAIPALASLARGLGHVPVPVLVVQHMPDQRELDLARALRRLGAHARPARAGDRLSHEFLLAPSGFHMGIDARERVHITRGDPINGHRPSAEVLMRSVVPLSRRVIAVVLSGLSNDGAAALAELAESGAHCFAQEPMECSAPDMPRAALSRSRRVHPIRIQELVAFVHRMVDCG
jgi:two-component system chemotaxis response regulator CheB